MPTSLPSRPTDATLSVTKAARLLGVHPNTIRAWSDAGRLRYFRINARGDRRYRIGDLQRFLAASEEGGPEHRAALRDRRSGRRHRALIPSLPPRTLREAPDEADAPVAGPDRRLDVVVGLSRLFETAASAPDAGHVLDAAAGVVCRSGGFESVTLWEARGEELVRRGGAEATVGRGRPTHPAAHPSHRGALHDAVASGRSAGPRASGANGSGRLPDDSGPERWELAVPVTVGTLPWGALHATGHGEPSADQLPAAEAAARVVGSLVRTLQAGADAARRVHRAEALRRVAGDIGARLDLEEVLAALVDHAMVLFAADRGAVFLVQADGRTTPAASRNLSAEYLAVARSFPSPSLSASAAAARRPLFSVGYPDDPRAAEVRAAAVQEGFDTLCTAPLMDGGKVLGLLNLYHDRPRPWADDELETVAALAAQASVAITIAQNFAQMATWAAQLQSIQQLGARLNGLTSVQEIGLAIATELRELIDYHNVRVYRLDGMDLVPVAMRGQVGEYDDETAEQLRVVLGQGITGWVAEHRQAQILPDAARDPRTNTIPGTEDDLDESMLLAPMVFEDQVLGVLVLSKLGLHQFTEDDLRLLVIFASIAAQAMANADATERLREQSAALERQVRSQRELLEITESILATLDPTEILEQISDRLAVLVGYDNIAIEVVDPASGLLRPLTARGVHAAQYLEPWESGETGLATWVVDRNEPVLVLDERSDERVNHFRDPDTIDGSLIVVPLRGRDGATGVLTLERLGVGNVYSREEFELVKLFAAQVSIALQNAEIHRAVEIRARTDDLTGLLNHGTFRDRLAAAVAQGDPFSLVMLDLDDFKSVNDALGHQAGDRLLAEIAGAIVSAGRESDHVFRYGGDEFVVILPGAGAAAATSVASRIQAAIHAAGGPGTRWAVGGVRVGASVGVASYPVDGSDAETILLSADRACFVAKRAGRDRIASAEEGAALAKEFVLQRPTPVDPPTSAGGPTAGV